MPQVTVTFNVTFVGNRYQHWTARTSRQISRLDELKTALFEGRHFTPLDKLEYGDHGVEAIAEKMKGAILAGKRIALYADYDVDGTLSCVSWIWFFNAIGFTNFLSYIPCRFKEGYGVNLNAVKKLIEDDHADVIITMDTGITANEEAAYCRSRGVDFLCTDHHKIQAEKMPEALLLNPKLHPEPVYQELCGCGITFVLLRRLAEKLGQPLPGVWGDLLALAGMATICDVVPLNAVNHSLARQGIRALIKSQRPIFSKLRDACSLFGDIDESDVGFRLGPRINAVGRLEHAELVVKAFLEENADPLVEKMESCNTRRKSIQEVIVAEALKEAMAYKDAPILFLGGDWHPGVVGIAASRIAETFWKPTWLFARQGGIGKGSARSIAGFDVTDAMSAAKDLFTKFGGHRAAGGFTFSLENEQKIRDRMGEFAQGMRTAKPGMWESSFKYDFEVTPQGLGGDFADTVLGLRPFGHGFEEPCFRLKGRVEKVVHMKDKATGLDKHTALTLVDPRKTPLRVVFFGEVLPQGLKNQDVDLLFRVQKKLFRGVPEVSYLGVDYSLSALH